MDEDDLPPKAREPEYSFAGALGFTVSRFLWIAVFLGFVGLLFYAALHWL